MAGDKTKKTKATKTGKNQYTLQKEKDAKFPSGKTFDNLNDADFKAFIKQMGQEMGLIDDDGKVI